MKHLTKILLVLMSLNLNAQIKQSMFESVSSNDTDFIYKGKYSYDFENNKIFYLKQKVSDNDILIEWFYEDYNYFTAEKLRNDSSLLDIYTRINIRHKKMNGEFENYCILDQKKILLTKGIITNNKIDGFWIKYDMYGNLFFTGLYNKGKLEIGYGYNFNDGYLHIYTLKNKLKKIKGPVVIQRLETNYLLMLDRNHNENIHIRY